MRHLGPVVVSLLLAAVLAGCGDTGISEEQLTQAKHEAFAQGWDEGYVHGVGAGQRQANPKLAEVRDAAFEHGVDYVLDDLRVVPGQDYAIAFAAGGRGFFVKDSLPMKPGKSYECPPQSPYCTVSEGTSEVPAATGEPAPGDPCDPNYPNVCLDPEARDYDCAGSGEDGPEFVEGPVRILGGDPYDLDGYPRDAIGCDAR